MSENSDEENEELIKYSGLYGGITQDSKNWDDFEEMGEKELLKHKIVKINIYTGNYSEKQAIFGFSCVFKNLFTGEIKKEKEHKGTEQFVDVKEFEIKDDEYLTGFHIRFQDGADYITQLGFSTSEKRNFIVGTEEGKEKKVTLQGEDNIIVGTFGCINKILDAMGVLFVSKEEFLKRKVSSS